ncbi:MAG: C4-type zinc ribbon domain-containing protein [Coriobacteriia bacterium]|nr:C4-type zinc ribbon domain-containing protein [Coriobacteriia bacterium]
MTKEKTSGKGAGGVPDEAAGEVADGAGDAASDNSPKALLLALVDLDQKISGLGRQIDKLPQRQELQKVHAQIADVGEKAKKLEQMRRQLAQKAKALADNRFLIEERMAEAQGHIDDSGADFREVASLSKELEGYVKQLEALKGERQALEDQEFKVAEVQEQAEKSTAQLHAREKMLLESLRAENGALLLQYKGLGEERERLTGLLGPAIVERYEKARATKAGIGAAALRGRTCEGCHIALSEGQIAQLKQAGEIGECPSCHRLLVIL